jgi:predicted deacylase
MRVADAIMDMHSGGIDSEVPFYAIYWEDGSETAKEARRLAEAAATPDIWASDDAWIRGAMYANATMKGVPGLIIECGSGGHLTDTDIEHHAAAIGGVATAMGIIPGTPPRQKRYRYVGTCELCWNQRGGFFLPATKVGAVVEKGDLIGRMMDSHGRIVEEIRSPNGPAFVAALARPYRAIHSGTMVAETAILRGGKA